MLELEEEFVRRQCDDIIALKPDLVFTEKGISDLAQHFLLKAGISAIRRVRKSDNNRIARACGATIVNRTEELQESDVGTGAGLFEVKKHGDEYFTYITECKDPKVCGFYNCYSENHMKEKENFPKTFMFISRYNSIYNSNMYVVYFRKLTEKH